MLNRLSPSITLEHIMALMPAEKMGAFSCAQAIERRCNEVVRAAKAVRVIVADAAEVSCFHPAGLY